MKQWKDRQKDSNIKYEDIDFSELRYVLYARKSSTDESHQENSIKDQLKLCREYAKKNNLNVVKELTESQSARTAGKRPVFRQMLNEIKAGKYEGILAWHPDRLCRNMLEAGELIDMLDNWDIVDLKFCQHPFENNSSGKMMLGMMFVFSKQYSDSLKERVQRGVDSNVERGLANGTRKWGYKREQMTGYYRPDENFDVIKNGFTMRLQGATTKEVWQFYRQNKVERQSPKTGRKDKMRSDTTVEKILKDPFYYGVQVQAGNPMHLCEKYDFKPMITEEEYNEIQAMGYKQAKKYNRVNVKPGEIFLPLKGMIICDVCKHTMKPGRHMPKDKSGRILYFECRNKHCTRKQRGVMAGVVYDQIYDILDRMQFDEAAYKKYVAELEALTDEKLEEIQYEIRSKNAIIANNHREMEQDWNRANGAPKAVKQHILKRLEAMEVETNQLEAERDDLKEKIKDPEALKLSQQDFVNLMKSLGDKMRSADIIQKDKIARKVFVNLYLDDQKRLTYLCKEPFDSVVSMSENLTGGARGARTPDLLGVNETL